MASVRALLQLAADLPAENPRRDAEVLLCHSLNKDRAWLYTWPEAEVEPAFEKHFVELLAARKRGMPVAYLTGLREFWTLQLEVSEHTLIPRPETETLIEWALELPLPAAGSVLDLGTGSGAIALSLAREREQWIVEGLDASVDALVVAQRNATRLGLARVTFHHSDWYRAIAERRFHLVVSNPPYIEENDVHLSEGDLPFEPQMALVAAECGLADLAHIVANAPRHLHPGGWLLLEHGYDQAEAVRGLLHDSAFFDVQTRRDIAGQERITGACWRAE